MTDRLFAVFLVAVFILVLGGTGALTNGAPVSVPWAEAIVPAGDDDDEGPDLEDLDCEELLALQLVIKSKILNPHAIQIDLEELQELIAECEAEGNGRASLRERLTSGLPFTMNISGTGNFVDVSGTYDPSTGTYTGNGTGTVAGFPNVTVVMVLNIAKNGDVTGTYTMGAGGELPGGQPGEYDITGVWPLSTPTPTPSPTATPAPTDTPTPTPTSTAAPGQQVTWADNNCKDGVGPVDALLALRFDAGLSANTNECPDIGANIDVLLASPHIWGNIDCKDGVTPVDALKILRFDADLSVSQEEGCPDMGSAVTIVEF